MNQKNIIIVIGVVVLLLLGGTFFFIKRRPAIPTTVTPSPTPLEEVKQLDLSQQPTVSLAFTSDAHYVTVTLGNLNADQLEYNIIYDATVKNNKIQTGVNSASKITGQTSFTQKQLLGSESSGHFTYHQNIQNAVMELVLRDAANRSVFTATYPFTVTPGQSVTLQASE
jgi:hypothetical protein